MGKCLCLVSPGQHDGTGKVAERTGLHHNLRRGAVDILLEACSTEPISYILIKWPAKRGWALRRYWGRGLAAYLPTTCWAVWILEIVVGFVRGTIVISEGLEQGMYSRELGIKVVYVVRCARGWFCWSVQQLCCGRCRLFVVVAVAVVDVSRLYRVN